MKFHQIISAHSRIIQVLISFEHTTFDIIPKSLVTLQFLKFQMKAYIQSFQIIKTNPGFFLRFIAKHRAL